jgi:hypothetical protein
VDLKRQHSDQSPNSVRQWLRPSYTRSKQDNTQISLHIHKSTYASSFGSIDSVEALLRAVLVAWHVYEQNMGASHSSTQRGCVSEVRLDQRYVAADKQLLHSVGCRIARASDNPGRESLCGKVPVTNNNKQSHRAHQSSAIKDSPSMYM